MASGAQNWGWQAGAAPLVRRLYSCGSMRVRRGYTLMEVLVVVGIVLILSTVGSASFVETVRQAKEQACFVKLTELNAYQQMYFRQFETFGTFDELQDQSLIARGYVEDDVILHSQIVGTEEVRGFIPEYTLDFEVDDENFRIIARPMMPDQAVRARWRLLGGQSDVRAMYVEEDGVVRYTTNNRPVR